MTRIFLVLVSALVLTAAVAGQAASATLIDRIVAVVGYDVVTQSELDIEMAPRLEELNARLRGDDLAQAVRHLRSDMLNMLIDKKLQLQEARVNGVIVEDEELDAAIDDIKVRNKMSDEQFEAALATEGYTLSDYRVSLQEQLMIIRLISAEVKSKVLLDESEISDYYEEHLDDFTEHESARVANIFFPARNGDMDAALVEATAARSEILAGASFEEMAVKCTGDPEAAETCVLGTFGPGQLSKEVEAAAFGLKAGEISEPIGLSGGYQLIKVMERTEKHVKPLDEVRAEIAEELSVRKGEVLYTKWIKDIRDRAYVEIRD